MKIAQFLGSKFKLKTSYTDDIWKISLLLLQLYRLNVLECHSECGWESLSALSARAVEQAKESNLQLARLKLQF